MLLNFSVKNFRSLKEDIDLSLIADPIKELPDNKVKVGNNDILKSIVIYGPNASGKSNLILAIKAMDYLVNNSMNFKPEEKIEPYDPYLLDYSNHDKPVDFTIEFLADGIKYEYSISFSKRRIEYEKLIYFPKKQTALLFERTRDSINFGDSFRGEKKAIENQLLPNQLLLSKAAVNNSPSAIIPFNFFNNKLKVYYDLNSKILYSAFIEEIQTNNILLDLLKKLISSLDTGIKDIKIKKSVIIKNIESSPVYDKNFEGFLSSHTIYFNNKPSGEKDFNFNKESHGTQKLLLLGAIIISALMEGRTIIIDEFEKDLHPLISKYLVYLFNDPEINKKNAQLIFATHEITLLSNENFRRDQIIFTEKDEFGATTVYKANDIKDLKINAPISKWYLNGRLGGTPIINDLDFKLELQNYQYEEDK